MGDRVRTLMRRPPTLSRNIPKPTLAVVPAVLTTYDRKLSEDGIIFKLLVPANGLLQRACLDVVEVTGEGPVKFVLERRMGKFASLMEFELEEKSMMSSLDMQVENGMVLTLTALEPERLTGVSLSVLYYLSTTEVPCVFTTVHTQMDLLEVK